MPTPPRRRWFQLPLCILVAAGGAIALIGTFVLPNIYCMLLMLWYAAIGTACGGYLESRKHGPAWRTVAMIGATAIIGFVLAITVNFLV